VFNDSAPPGKEMKYARLERERRFLLSAPPEDPVVRIVRIVDQYLSVPGCAYVKPWNWRAIKALIDAGSQPGSLPPHSLVNIDGRPRTDPR
jgi:hypothetical protein